MATIGKTKTGKCCAQVRTHQKYISKTFISKAHASKWAKEEIKVKKNIINTKLLFISRNFNSLFHKNKLYPDNSLY